MKVATFMLNQKKYFLNFGIFKFSDKNQIELLPIMSKWPVTGDIQISRFFSELTGNDENYKICVEKQASRHTLSGEKSPLP